MKCISPKSVPALELHSRAAPSVEAHHHSDGPDAGRNSRGRWIIKKNCCVLLELLDNTHCQGVVQLEGLVQGSPKLVPLRLRLVSLFYSLKVPLNKEHLVDLFISCLGSLLNTNALSKFNL